MQEARKGDGGRKEIDERTMKEARKEDEGLCRKMKEARREDRGSKEGR